MEMVTMALLSYHFRKTIDIPSTLYTASSHPDPVNDNEDATDIYNRFIHSSLHTPLQDTHNALLASLSSHSSSFQKFSNQLLRLLSMPEDNRTTEQRQSTFFYDGNFRNSIIIFIFYKIKRCNIVLFVSLFSSSVNTLCCEY